MSSLVSAKGPSMTVRDEPENFTLAPFEVGWRPSPASMTDEETPALMRFSMPEKGKSQIAIIPSGQDLFKFVLHRAQDGQLIAAHESHYSHSSHQPHSSHYSSR